jgi:hypothetical protein
LREPILRRRRPLTIGANAFFALVHALPAVPLRFTRGLAALLDAIRVLEPESPQVDALTAIIDEL